MGFRVYYLHGLGSSCESTKATLVRELVEGRGGEFVCFHFEYLKGGSRPWEVLEFLRARVSWDAPFALVGSSMGAYSWLDYLVNLSEVFEVSNFRKAVLITPPTTLFDNLEKWNPLFGRERVFLRYGEDYALVYRTLVRLMHWDLKFANYRLLTLARPKVVSVVAKRDEVVNNGPIYELKRVACGLRLYELDDGHQLKNRLGELRAVLERELGEAFSR
ncbi:MAG: hypothetical protein GXO08_05380 [Aquificae bacterium]|nr:hypothetical protein [Aquificota bacterium]